MRLIMNKLQVYIAPDCWTCDETESIVADVAPQFPEVTVEVINLENVDRPENVFAVPTYVLNGRVISLGNPTRAELRQKLAS